LEFKAKTSFDDNDDSVALDFNFPATALKSKRCQFCFE